MKVLLNVLHVKLGTFEDCCLMFLYVGMEVLDPCSDLLSGTLHD